MNKPRLSLQQISHFDQWAEIFPNAACAVALINRLVHHAEIVQIEARSFRLKEAEEQRSQRACARHKRTASTLDWPEESAPVPYFRTKHTPRCWGLLALPDPHQHLGAQRISRFPCEVISRHAQGLQPREVREQLVLAMSSVLPSDKSKIVGNPKFLEFRGSIPGPSVPLPTL